MPLWLEELLQDPGLGLVLVAGRAGLDQRGPVRWAHISEIPDPTPWLEGGEVLLTTGLAIKDDPAMQRRLIASLDRRGCSGVGYGVGIATPDVPPALIEEADARQLPLFTVPYEVPFIAVTKRVSRHIFEEHYATLRSAVELHRQVLAAVLADSGVEALLRTVLRPMPEFSAVLFDYYGQLLGRWDGPGVTDTVDERALWDVLHQRSGDRDRMAFEWSGGHVTWATVRLGDQVEAVLAVVGPRPPLEHEQLLLEQGLTGVSLELARGQSVREARRNTVEELLDEVAEGGLSERLVARQLRRLGLDTADGYVMLCLLRPAFLVERVLCGLVEDAAGADGRAPIVGRHDQAVFCITSADEAAERIARAIRARGWTGVTVGRSRRKHDPGALTAAMREARMAAAAPHGGIEDGVRDVGSLGLPGLIAGIHDQLGADAFVTRTLGPLLTYDAQEGTQLVWSLEVFLRHGCRPGPAAEELVVHRHTLSYRLDRIRDLTGRDPRDGAHLLEYGLALALHSDRGDALPAPSPAAG